MHITYITEMNVSLFRDDSKDNTNDSILRNEDAPELEIVEFTPHLTWKCKAKSKEN